MSRLAGDDTCADKRIIAEDTPPYRRAKNALAALDVAEWRCVLVDCDNFQQPPLLRTCRLIREEASAIYYNKNSFWIDCPHGDPSAAITFSQHAMRGSKGPYGMDIQLGLDIPDVDANIMRWLRAHYHNQVVCRPLGDQPETLGETERMECAIGLMFESVDILNKAGMSWSVIEKTLDNTLWGLHWVAKER